MSVALNPSPFARAKRLFEEDWDSVDRHQPHSAHAKRSRLHGSPSASGRCVQFAEALGTSYAVTSSTLSALLGLFPEMDEKTVTTVLSECGNNIDAAIKRLTELRLSVEEPAGASEHQGVQETESAANASAPGHDAAPSTPQPGPQTGDQWVEYLVSEMASAQNLSDARGRAAGVLQQFERFVKDRSKDEVKSTIVKASELQRENTILKRAVQIQNSKLQEKATQEQEVQHLKHMLAQYQEQVRNLEVSNYSLALHLQQATSTSPLPGQRRPDVF